MLLRADSAASRNSQGTNSGSEVCLRRLRTWMVGTIGEPRVGSIWFDTRKRHFNEHVQHALACRTIDTAQTLACSTFRRRPGISSYSAWMRLSSGWCGMAIRNG
jgi:hypothetical protein